MKQKQITTTITRRLYKTEEVVFTGDGKYFFSTSSKSWRRLYNARQVITARKMGMTVRTLTTKNTANGNHVYGSYSKSTKIN